MTVRIGTPAAPPGWEDTTGELIRFADPSGEAVAWMASGHGANVVGFAVRRPGGWTHVLHTTGPGTLSARPTRYGCPILCPFPGHVRGARYTWRGREYPFPPNQPDGQGYAHGFAPRHPWRVLDTAPATVSAELVTATDLTVAERACYPFDLRLRLTARLADGALRLELEATNEGVDDAPVGLGLHPYFDSAFLVDDRSQLRVQLPGSRERLLAGMFQSSGTRPANQTPVSLPQVGETTLIARTDLGVHTRATLMGPGSGARVILTLDKGCHDLLLFAPDEQPSVSLEPLSCAHLAVSRSEDDPERLAALAPGSRLRLAATIAVRESGEES